MLKITSTARTVFVCGAILVAYYINKPPPKLSPQVAEWLNASQIFKYNNTVNIHFHDIKSPDMENSSVEVKQVLLVIHGFPASSYIWKDLIPKFHVKFSRVILPDLLGLGFSDKPIGHSYSMIEQQEILEKLLIELGVENVHLVAHDYGVSIGQEFIHKANNGLSPVAVKSVCFLNGGLVPSRHDLLFIQKLFSSPTFKKIMPYLLTYPVYKNRLSSIFGPYTRPTDEQLQDIWAIMLYKNGVFAIPDIFAYIFERRANEKRWVSALQETTIPLHLVYGPEDPVNTPQGFLKTYRELVPGSSIAVLEGVGHYPQMEDPEAYFGSYKEFLQTSF